MYQSEFWKTFSNHQFILSGACNCKLITTAQPTTFGKYLDQLPREIMLIIMLYATSTLAQVAKLSSLSKSFYSFIRTPQIWKQLAIKYNIQISSLEFLCSMCSFRRFYFTQYCEWNAYRHHDNTMIFDNNNNNKQQMHNLNHGWNTAVFGGELTKGRHMYKFRILECESIIFGVQSSKHFDHNRFPWPGTGMPGITATDSSVAYYSSMLDPLFRKNDVIKMVVDLDYKTVWFYRISKMLPKTTKLIFNSSNVLNEHPYKSTWTTNDPMEVVVVFCSLPNIVEFVSYHQIFDKQYF